MTSRPSRLSAVVLLTLFAAPSWFEAAPTRPARPRANRAATSRESPSPRSWQWLTGLWDAVGCSLDPGGACQPAVGCSLDPNGCSPAAPLAPVGPGRGEEGCTLDPGGCQK